MGSLSSSSSDNHATFAASLLLGKPAAHERRLAEAGLGGDQRQRAAEPLAATVQQPRPRDQLRSRRRRVDLGLEQ